MASFRHSVSIMAATIGLLVLTITAPVLAGEKTPLPQVKWPRRGTLIAGPVNLGVEPGTQRIRWEVVGEKASRVVLSLEGGEPQVLDGFLMSAEPETVELPGRVYEVRLPDLPACTEVRYRLEPFEKKGLPHRFRTPPAPGSLCPGRNRIVIYGDSRKYHDVHRSLMPSIRRSKPNLAINVGDLVHTAQNLHEWPVFFSIEGRFLGKTLFTMVPGNHDAYHGLGLGGAMLRRYFGTDGEGGTGHWSFDWGPVHFVMLDLYWGLPMDGAGRQWLEDDLKKVPPEYNVIVVLHEPLYSFGYHRPRDVIVSLRPFFKSHFVDAVCAGHAHLYEHFFMDSIHFLTLGGFGASLHKANARRTAEFAPFLKKTVAQYHFLQLDIGETELEFTIIDSTKSQVLEKWTLPRRTSKAASE